MLMVVQATPKKISFCLTEEEAEIVNVARHRLAKQGVLRNQSEIIRAGIGLLRRLSDPELIKTAQATSRFKPGRKPPR